MKRNGILFEKKFRPTLRKKYSKNQEKLLRIRGWSPKIKNKLLLWKVKDKILKQNTFGVVDAGSNYLGRFNMLVHT